MIENAPREVPVPATGLLADALARVDWSDAHAVPRPAGSPADPRVWADAVFRDPPRWVGAAMGVRDALVAAAGIARSGPSSFATRAATATEVLLGSDERHLDFRVSVLVEPCRVVVSTVVALHGARGRCYFAVVRPVHPLVVRAMLGRAARRITSGAPSRTPSG